MSHIPGKETDQWDQVNEAGKKARVQGIHPKVDDNTYQGQETKTTSQDVENKSLDTQHLAQKKRDENFK